MMTLFFAFFFLSVLSFASSYRDPAGVATVFQGKIVKLLPDDVTD